MTVDQAREETLKILGPEFICSKRNGVCIITRPLSDQEKADRLEPKVNTPGAKDAPLTPTGERIQAAQKLNVNRDERVVVGAGPSWLAALRYAVRPVLQAKQKAEQERRAKHEAEENAERTEFQNYLEQQFLEFKAKKQVVSTEQPSAPAAATP